MSVRRAINWFIEKAVAKDTYAGRRFYSVADPPPPPPTWSSPDVDTRRETYPDGSTGWAILGDTGYAHEAPAVNAGHRQTGHSHVLGDRWLGHDAGGVPGPSPYEFRYRIVRDPYEPWPGDSGPDRGGGPVNNPNPRPGYRS